MSTTAPEYLTTLRDGFAGAVQQWMDQSTAAWDQWSQAWSPVVAAAGLGMPGAPGGARGHQHGGHHHKGHQHEGHHHGERDCGAKDCGCHDSCGCGDACDCCVPEADVVVHARAGEVRVVPFRLHNPWRREREVSLEIGPWHRCSGDDLQIRAELEEKKLVLGPCEDRVVRLLLSTRGSADDGSSNTKDTKDTKEGRGATATLDVAGDVTGARTRRATDVDSCASAYADVRFEGCARSQRVAVVVLPADCDAVEVGCDCGCCC